MDRISNKLMDISDAVALVKNGDTLFVNSFLALSNPWELNVALTQRHRETGAPKNLTVFCSAAFGSWRQNDDAEGYITEGAVDKVLLGHFPSMPGTSRAITENKLEAYNLPLGVMSHMCRAAAAHKSYVRSKVGLNLFSDPRVGTCAMNSVSKEQWVSVTEENSQELLLYKVVRPDVCFIKGSSCDEYGNISLEDECVALDTLSVAQATHNNGGKVIVQVARLIKNHQRPWNVILPAMLVDAVVLCPRQRQMTTVSGHNAAVSGDVFAPEHDIDRWAQLLAANMETRGSGRVDMHRVIGNRAFEELKEGMIANIGVGIPELVATSALNNDMLSRIHLTVESGCVGGLPTSGQAFGGTIGADSISYMAQLFDFYHGGGLDICFIGGLQVDGEGNVNGHFSPSKLTGIGGFADITQCSKKVVFCLTFSAKGFDVAVEDGKVNILKEGQVHKFVSKVDAVSFSPKNARAAGQEVMYVTERCVFRLAEEGLEIIEVFDGVDLKKDVLELLPFEVKVSPEVRVIKAKL